MANLKRHPEGLIEALPRPPNGFDNRIGAQRACRDKRRNSPGDK
jgi:hypothetical protein